MQPKLIKTEQAQYVQSEWDGTDTSGLIPIGDHVLILPDAASTKAGTKGLIELPDDQVERMSLASESGIIVAIGDDAYFWNADRTRPFGGTRPKPGDHVMFERYAGRVMRGRDGKHYRLMSDNAVGAIMEINNG